uniref:Uncharacterized protein n=1 Tax=Arundo donax TaxID=35708 RepID=A0A0A9FQW6_ARUDO
MASNCSSAPNCKVFRSSLSSSWSVLRAMAATESVFLYCQVAYKDLLNVECLRIERQMINSKLSFIDVTEQLRRLE